jgi:lipoprotein-releasing system ATP-binding protein
MIKSGTYHQIFRSVQVLKGVSLEVAHLPKWFYYSASGAGKTTFLHVLGTLTTPDSGQV